MRIFRPWCMTDCELLRCRMFLTVIAAWNRMRYWCLHMRMTDHRWRLGMFCATALVLMLLIFFIIHFSTSYTERPAPITTAAVELIKPSKGSLSDSPLVNWSAYQYAVIFDCGSSGSRVFIYYWPEHSGIPGQLLDIRQLQGLDGKPAVRKVEPGLSSFASDPSKATNQIVDLLDFAKQFIPVQCHQDTFVYIMATAGMRMLSDTDQRKILSDIRVNVPLRTPFRLLPENVEIISGKWEGIYAWISINSALGRLGLTPEKLRVPDSTPGPASTDTVGIIDMGGGSVQIAFEIDPWDHPPNDVTEKFSLGTSDSDTSLTFRLYVATYLGLGANSAMKSHIELLAKNNYKFSKRVQASTPAASDSSTSHSDSITDPCHPAGYYAALNVSIESNRPQSIIVNGSGDFTSCKNNLQHLLATVSSNSELPKYAMSSCGLYCSPLSGLSPAIAVAGKAPSSKRRKKFYGFSEFWYSAEDILKLGGTYHREAFEGEAANFCQQDWQQLVTGKTKYVSADYSRFTTQCFKSAWVSVILHSGFLFEPDTQNFASVLTINGSEVHWTLGALLFKTRALPLRRIQLMEAIRHGSSGSGWHFGGGGSSGKSTFYAQFIPFLPQATMLVCGVIVFVAIIFYCHSLGPWRRRRSMSQNSPYDQAEMGLLEESNGVHVTDDHDHHSSTTVWSNINASDDRHSPSSRAFSASRKNRMSLSVGSRMHHLA